MLPLLWRFLPKKEIKLGILCLSNTKFYSKRALPLKIPCRKKMSILVHPKQILVVLKSEKQKKKRVLSSFCNFSTFHFQLSTFPFTIFLFFFSIFTPFPFFLVRSLWGALCPLFPACYATVYRPIRQDSLDNLCTSNTCHVHSHPRVWGVLRYWRTHAWTYVSKNTTWFSFVWENTAIKKDFVSYCFTSNLTA